jgi:hypothetical protein
MAIGHEPKDGWHPLTNDPMWPAQEGGAGLCPKVKDSSRPLPVFAGGHTYQNTGRDVLRLENELGKLAVRVAALEDRKVQRGPIAKIPDGEEDCE